MVVESGNGHGSGKGDPPLSSEDQLRHRMWVGATSSVHSCSPAPSPVDTPTGMPSCSCAVFSEGQ